MLVRDVMISGATFGSIRFSVAIIMTNFGGKLVGMPLPRLLLTRASIALLGIPQF